MANETKFTPGPWSVRDCPMKAAQTDRADDGRIKLIDFNDGTYEGTLAIVQTEESEANASLIAAAPELYSVLETAVMQGERILNGEPPEEGPDFDGWFLSAKAALAKARGES